MNTENSKTSEPYRFKLDLTDKLNLKNPNKNMALANLSNQLGMIILIYLMVLILLKICKIILNLSLENMKL